MTASVAERVVQLLRERTETLATAESLTGGLLGAALTDVPGASAAYRGGVISYATPLKATLAGVAPETLERHGPVASDTATEMALGIAKRCGAHWGLAVTGVAGPDPQDGHPVGEIFVAICGPAADQGRTVRLELAGSRREIREQTAEQALQLLEELLSERPARQLA